MTATGRRTPDVARWLCDALVEQGVPVLFGNPGSTELPLTDAIGAAGAPEYVLGLHEATVMGMADGYAQARGGLGAVNVHVQPGLANSLSGILNAARARVPLLVTVGQQVQAMLPGAPFLGGELVALAAPLAKGAWEVPDPAELPGILARAVSLALEPPRGPVVVSLPLDVQVAPAPAPFTRVEAHRPPAPAGAALDDAALLLARAVNPVVLAGDEVAHSGAGAALLDLAERIGAPVFGEPMAATVPVPTDAPPWRGALGPFALDIGRALASHDVVVAVGMPVFRLFGTSPGDALAAHQRLIHIEVDPAEVGRVHPPEVAVVGDLGMALEGVVARLGPTGMRERARGAAVQAEAADARRRARARVVAGAATRGQTISPEVFALAIAGAVGPRDLVVDEALTSGRALKAVMSRRTAATWRAHRGSALGWGLPAAVGAAIAQPGRRVMALQGDGSLLFGVHALWTAARRRQPLALVVADNGGYEILRAGMEGLTGRPEGDWPGLALTDPRVDVAGLCASFGADVAGVERRADLPGALRDLWRRAEDGPAVLVVQVRGRTPPVGHPVAPTAG
ncbi:MAG: thiamine pyrophosphate-binding protein [Miltoncostaeaceae bacterium]